MRFLALWLAAFWLPLTLHCELANLDDHGCIAVCCEDQPSFDYHPCCQGACHCDVMVCSVLKTSNFSLRETKVSTPSIVITHDSALNSFKLESEPTPTDILSDATSAPEEIQRRWTFILRANQSPRTPPARC